MRSPELIAAATMRFIQDSSMSRFYTWSIHMPVRWMLLIAGLSFSLPVTAEDWNADEKAVWKLEEDYWRFVSAGDVDAYVSLWHDDFALDPGLTDFPNAGRIGQVCGRFNINFFAI